MPSISDADDGPPPPIDRLDAHARRVFYDMLLNERRPVAVVGSGMSIIYGGVSWKRSVELALERAQDLLEAPLQLEGGANFRRQRFLAAIEVFMRPNALDTPEDKYLALDLCEEALDWFDTIRRLEPIPSRVSGDISTFRSYLAKIYRDDTLFMRISLEDRFAAGRSHLRNAEKQGLPEATSIAEIRSKIEDLHEVGTNLLACKIYSLSFLHQLLDRITNKTALQGLLGAIKSEIAKLIADGWNIQDNVLPIDRRSIFCVFLAEVDPIERRKLLKSAIDDVENILLEPKDGPSRQLSPPHRPLLDPLRTLQNWLGIRRYITLNFDFELEHNLMLDDVRAIEPRPFGLLQAKAAGVLTPDGDTGGLYRRYADGLAGSTDIYQQAAIARLFEFALDSSDYRAQILHLHGRADHQETMVLTDRDSNRVHRSNRAARTLLELGLDVVLTGSPILFVGIGLSEPEITRSLRDLVSRGHATVNNPTFAIMAIDKDGTAAWRQQLGFFRKYGIHLIAAGLPAESRNTDGGPDDVASLAFQIEVIKQLLARVEAARKSPLDEREELLNNARRVWPMADASDPEPWLDHLAFKFLAARICQAHATTIQQWQADSWQDYLEKLSEKLFSLAVLNTLRSLRNGFVAYYERRELPATYDAKWTSLNDKGRPLARAMRVRDQSIWDRLKEQSTELHYCRHMATLPVIGPAARPGTSAEYAEPETLVKLTQDQTNVAQSICRTTSTFITCFAPLGAGKGSMVRHLKTLYKLEKRPSLFINCNFGIEFESVIIHVLVFILRYTKPDASTSNAATGSVPYSPFIERISRISNALSRGPKSWTLRPVIVISGLERLIDAKGKPLAPELDLLLQVLRCPNLRACGFQLVIVAGQDCRAHVEASPTGDDTRSGWLRHRRDIAWPKRRLAEAEPGFLGNLTRTALAKCDDPSRLQEETDTNPAFPARATLKMLIGYAARHPTEPFAPNSARSPAIEAVLRVVLERWHDLAFEVGTLSPADRTRAELDREILTEMVFVAMPLELGFLLHLDKPKRHLSTIRTLVESTTDESELSASIARLRDFGLLVEISPARRDGEVRFAPHRSVVAEVRHRLGIRSGDEMLSNTFSLTLALSMPTDLIVADTDIHERLKRNVGRLRGAWKDGILKEDVQRPLNTLRDVLLGPEAPPAFDSRRLRWDEPMRRLERAVRMAVTPTDVPIRAAAAIVRGFFSAACLVAQMPEDHPRPAGAVGEFEDHKLRLGELVDRLREIQNAKAEANEILSEIEGHFETLRDPVRTIRMYLDSAPEAKPALYGSELVWLLNECAVVALLQGDLYQAQRGFRQAERANRLFRAREPGISWRRLRINRALLWIERGRIGEARNRLVAIKPEMELSSFRSPHEDRLCAPLVASYLAYCDYLQGNRRGAAELFSEAIPRLAETEQRRALAVAHIRSAELHFTWGEHAAGREQIRLGLAVAESGRQMDILWRARLVQVRGLERDTDERLMQTIFNEARSYAQIMEMPRVAVLALRGEADFKLLTNDLEAAGVLAAEAMTVATRYGMVLERIDLRVLMGTILLRTGNPSGRYLLERAIEHADRIGYQLAVDRAQEAILDAKRLGLIESSIDIHRPSSLSRRPPTSPS